MAELMKAIWVEKSGGPEVLELREVERPTPGPSEVLVKLTAIGINYSNIGRRLGTYAGFDLPAIMGSEGCGQIVELGAGVNALSEGDVVSFRGSTTGSYAEYATVATEFLYRVPDDISPETACALQVQGMTAYILVNNAAPVGAGDSCLIHAGAGGVGHMVIQIAKANGARVLTTVGSEEKAEIAKSYGADEVILYRTEDFSERVLELTDGKGVNAVYDGVGAATLAGSIACAGYQGRVIVFGSPSDGGLQADLRLTAKNAVTVGFGRLSQFVNTAEHVKTVSDTLVDMVRDGTLRLNIAPPYPLADASAAQRALENRETTGKLILLP